MKIFGIAGYSGSGKTTLLEKLIPQFTARGLKVSVIKHAHHGFDLDKLQVIADRIGPTVDEIAQPLEQVPDHQSPAFQRA